YCFVTGSKPRTYRSDASGVGVWPQPFRWSEPLKIRSAAPSGFDSENEISARCGMCHLARSSEMLSDALELHGPLQLLRLAIVPICFSRHSRTDGSAFAISDVMPALVAESAVVVVG